MASTIKVRILRGVGNPSTGVILRPGAVADLPEFWAKRFIENGSAIAVKNEKAKKSDPKKKKNKGNGKNNSAGSNKVGR